MSEINLENSMRKNFTAKLWGDDEEESERDFILKFIASPEKLTLRRPCLPLCRYRYNYRLTFY